MHPQTSTLIATCTNLYDLVWARATWCREVEHELDLLFFRRRNHSQNHASNRGGTHSSGPSQGTRTMEGMGSMGIPEHSTSVSHGSGSSGSGSTGDARLRRSSGSSSSSKNASGSMGRAGGRGAFRVHVEDVREGILVSELRGSSRCVVCSGRGKQLMRGLHRNGVRQSMRGMCWHLQPQPPGRPLLPFLEAITSLEAHCQWQ